MPSALDNRSANLFKALSSPRRLQIVRLLMQHVECDVTSLAKTVNLKTSSMSQHLRALNDYGVVAYRRGGKQVLYHVAREARNEAEWAMLSALVDNKI